MNSASEPVGSLETALAHTTRLLESNPARAIEQAGEILKAVPRQPLAMLLLAVAHRKNSEADAALPVLDELIKLQPKWAAAHYERGLVLGDLRRGDEAIKSLGLAVQLEPQAGDAWRALGDHFTAVGDTPA